MIVFSSSENCGFYDIFNILIFKPLFLEMGVKFIICVLLLEDFTTRKLIIKSMKYSNN